MHDVHRGQKPHAVQITRYKLFTYWYRTSFLQSLVFFHSQTPLDVLVSFGSLIICRCSFIDFPSLSPLWNLLLLSYTYVSPRTYLQYCWRQPIEQAKAPSEFQWGFQIRASVTDREMSTSEDNFEKNPGIALTHVFIRHASRKAHFTQKYGAIKRLSSLLWKCQLAVYRVILSRFFIAPLKVPISRDPSLNGCTRNSIGQINRITISW